MSMFEGRGATATCARGGGAATSRRRAAVGALLTLAVVGASAPPVAGAASAPKVRVTKVSPVAGAVGVRGTVTLPAGAKRTSARVRITLSGGGETTSVTAKVTSKGRFRAVLRTSISGEAVLRVRLRVAGKNRGAPVRRAATVPAGGEGSADPAADGPLVGLFRVTAGRSTSKGATGSYFRMKTPTGEYLGNYSSSASDPSYTLFRAGTDGGLLTTGYQPAPSPAFDGNGNATAKRILQTEPFFGVRFGVSTNQLDPQTQTAGPVPQIVNDGGKLSGQLTAWAAQWNTQSFNQGSPKPDGSSSGFTRPVTGTYDPSTGKFVLEWASLIVGGPFDSFAGEWHLEGTFVGT